MLNNTMCSAFYNPLLEIVTIFQQIVFYFVFSYSVQLGVGWILIEILGQTHTQTDTHAPTLQAVSTHQSTE